MDEYIEKYKLDVNVQLISEKIEQLTQRAAGLRDKTILTHIYGLIDLTSLNTTDNEEKIRLLTEKVNEQSSKFPELPPVAAICVYPSFIPVVKNNLKDKNVKIASVAGSFPSSQTFLDIKLKEIERVLEEGAEEIDIVISVGKFLSGNYEYVSREIRKIKQITGKAILKVILETGALKDLQIIKKASFLALESGADFLKTSTGKFETGATPGAVWIMCEAIREFSQTSGKNIGIKPSGGISDISVAVLYFLIVNEVLGNDWLKPERFRFGTSQLPNLLLGEKYF